MSMSVPFAAFARPDRSVEARAWLRSHATEALAWRGSQGETLLHWAAMADLGLMLDLLAVGLDANEADGDARRPLDWLNDRLWLVCVDGQSGLDQQGRWRVKAQTEEMVPGLWNWGGRSGMGQEVLDSGMVWSRAGCWSLLDLVQSDSGRTWQGWGRHRETVLHGWVVADDTAEKHRFLERVLQEGLAIDSPDAQGRTPLWYAVDAWLSRPERQVGLRRAITALLAAGADPALPDAQGISPAALPLHVQASDAVQLAIAEALDTDNPDVEPV